MSHHRRITYTECTQNDVVSWWILKRKWLIFIKMNKLHFCIMTSVYNLIFFYNAIIIHAFKKHRLTLYYAIDFFFVVKSVHFDRFPLLWFFHIFSKAKEFTLWSEDKSEIISFMEFLFEYFENRSEQMKWKNQNVHCSEHLRLFFFFVISDF